MGSAAAASEGAESVCETEGSSGVGVSKVAAGGSVTMVLECSFDAATSCTDDWSDVCRQERKTMTAPDELNRRRDLQSHTSSV